MILPMNPVIGIFKLATWSLVDGLGRNDVLL